MSEQIIICPSCETEIPLTEALTNQIEENLQEKIKAEVSKKEKQLQKKIKNLETRENELNEMQESIDSEVETKLSNKLQIIESKEKEKAEKKVSVELKDLKASLKEKDDELEEAQKNELQLRERERKLESEKKAFELNMKRKLDDEKGKIEKNIRESIYQEHLLEVSDYQKKIDSMTQQINSLKQKAEQGSQQAQGEVLELQLEKILQNNFPHDNILPVPKGVKGADVIHEVFDNNGNLCGKIIWESKRTKKWNKGWIEKLKEDQRNEKAEIGVIYSMVLPKEIEYFGLLDGIWVTDNKSLIGLATALRLNILELNKFKIANVGKNQKMEMVYNYLSGTEFKNRIEAIVEVFLSLSKDLESERTAITKMWSKRQKQIQKMMENTVGMYGDLQGIVGASLPEIEKIDIIALPKADNLVQ